VEIPEGATTLDIKDPQNMNNNNCCSYLEILISRFKGEIDAALAREERAPPRSREMWMEC